MTNIVFICSNDYIVSLLNEQHLHSEVSINLLHASLLYKLDKRQQQNDVIVI